MLSTIKLKLSSPSRRVSIVSLQSASSFLKFFVSRHQFRSSLSYAPIKLLCEPLLFRKPYGCCGLLHSRSLEIIAQNATRQQSLSIKSVFRQEFRFWQ